MMRLGLAGTPTVAAGTALGPPPRKPDRAAAEAKKRESLKRTGQLGAMVHVTRPFTPSYNAKLRLGRFRLALASTPMSALSVKFSARSPSEPAPSVSPPWTRTLPLWVAAAWPLTRGPTATASKPGLKERED